MQYVNRALAHHSKFVRSRCSRTHHLFPSVQHALDLSQQPLTDDVEAQKWCSHDETLVRAAMLHAIGREEFVRIARWVSDEKSEHFHASTMLFTLATDVKVFDQGEKKALLLEARALLAKDKEAPGWIETKERLVGIWHRRHQTHSVVLSLCRSLGLRICDE